MFDWLLGFAAAACVCAVLVLCVYYVVPLFFVVRG